MINADLLSMGNAFWSDIANHLWQSTLFAAAAWLLTIFLKKNRARIRFWIWFSVTVKFLIPFSIMVNLGNLIAPEWMNTPPEISTQLNVIHSINQPFSPSGLKEVSAIDIKNILPSTGIVDSSPASHKLPAAIFVLWLCGTFAVLISWRKRDVRVSRMAQNAEPLIDSQRIEAFHRIKQENRISNAVRLASTRDTMEPGVYGVFRPVLLLPSGILDHVNDSELEAILLHEFEHIRCRDNLIASIHMIVQALFWFHPVVWFTGSKLVFERELACDESVLRSGKNPGVYAEGILKVCEYYFRSPLVCVSGVVGSNLKKRVEGIMKNQTGHNMSIVKRLFLAMAGLAVLGMPLMIGMVNAPSSQARTYNNDSNKYNAVKYKSDSYRVSGKLEIKNRAPETINEKPVQGSLSDISNAGTTLLSESSDDPISKNEGPVIVATDAGIQTVEAPQVKTEPYRAVQVTVERNDTKDSIILAEGKAPVKMTTDSDSRNVGLKTESVDEFISMGTSFIKNGRLEDAVSSFNRAIDLDSGNAVAYVARGSVYQRLGRFDNAITDYNEAIKINPDLAVAYQNRGSVYFIQGNFEKAIPDYNRAIKIDPGIAAAYQDRGSIYLAQGRFDDAISDYNKSLELNPADGVVHNFRGLAYFSKKQYQEALGDFNRAIKLNPDYVNSYINRGTYYHYIKEYSKAVADYNTALTLNPESTARKKMEDYCKWAESGKSGDGWWQGAPHGLRTGVVPEGQVAQSNDYVQAFDNWSANN